MLIGDIGDPSELDRLHTELRRDIALAAGVNVRRLFEDHASGATEDRSGRIQALAFGRTGDVMLVWKLDWLVSHFHTIVNALLGKTIFPCRYLHSEALRREIHEISMLASRLSQNCMVYFNTLIIRKILAYLHWRGRLTPRDSAELTPLIGEHVNPYG